MRGIDLAKRDREPVRTPYKAALFGLNQERETSPQRRRGRRGNAEKQTQYVFSALSQRTLRLCGESSSFHFPRFSYHFKFAVADPIQITSTRRSAFKSAAAQAAAAMPPSSSTVRVHCSPSA